MLKLSIILTVILSSCIVKPIPEDEKTENSIPTMHQLNEYQGDWEDFYGTVINFTGDCYHVSDMRGCFDKYEYGCFFDGLNSRIMCFEQSEISSVVIIRVYNNSISSDSKQLFFVQR